MADQAAGADATDDKPDPVAAMGDQLAALTDSQAQMHQWLQSEPWKEALTQAAAGPSADEGAPDFSFLDEGDTFGDQQFDPAKLAAGLAPIIQKAVGEATAPLQHEIHKGHHEQAVNQLLDSYPELRDDKVAGHVVDTAKKLAEQMGTPALGNNPKFWEQTYLAGRSLEQARQEGTAPPAVAHLEGAGGAGPGGGGQGDLVDSIMNVKQGSAVLPFR